jgi:hypothetical protein
VDVSHLVGRVTDAVRIMVAAPTGVEVIDDSTTQ